jgi:hypothetical protein
VYVQVNLPDTHGPTVTEAMRTLDASFEAWRRGAVLRASVIAVGGLTGVRPNPS